MFDTVGATTLLVHELSQVDGGRPPVRHAEVATMLRLAGEVSLVGGHTTIRAEFGAPESATRLRDTIAALYGRVGAVETAVGHDGTVRCRVRVTAPGSELARATGLVDRTLRPLPGLPSSILSGTATAAAVLRGAVLVRGAVSRRRGRLQLQVACPGPGVALTLVAAAHRLGLSARDRETVTGHRVLVRDPDSIDAALRTVGAAATADALREHAAPAAEVVDTYNADRARRALDVLGDTAPRTLRDAGRLRADHADLSLAQLGRLADPPLSRDAVATRLRRLFAAAEEHAPR